MKTLVPRGRSRRLLALALLGVLCLGSACHFWHHLLDPDCGSEGKRGAQTCATCAALHGPAAGPEPIVAAPPASTEIAGAFPTEAPHPALPALAGAAPRAPPAA